MPMTLEIEEAKKQFTSFTNEDGEDCFFVIGQKVVLNTGTTIVRTKPRRSYSKDFYGNEVVHIGQPSFSVTRLDGSKISGLTERDLRRQFGDVFVGAVLLGLSIAMGG